MKGDRTKGNKPRIRPCLLVFFDGECPFCVGWVKFLLDRDGGNCLRFASLQSGWTQDFFVQHGLPRPGMASIVVWNGNEIFRQSDAFVELGRALTGVWCALRWIRWVPKRIRDRIYTFIGERRYIWFGRLKSCWLPETGEQVKFLDLEDPVYKDGGNGHLSENSSGNHPG